MFRMHNITLHWKLLLAIIIFYSSFSIFVIIFSLTFSCFEFEYILKPNEPSAIHHIKKFERFSNKSCGLFKIIIKYGGYINHSEQSNGENIVPEQCEFRTCVQQSSSSLENVFASITHLKKKLKT